VGLFRRRHETHNEQLMRDAGLDQVQLEQPTVLEELGIPIGRTRDTTSPEWDFTVTVTAPGLEGDRIEFTTLPIGDVIVSEDKGDADLSPFADAVEKALRPPYKAFAARQDSDVWAVVAKRIEVAQISFADADSLELSRRDSWQELRVDGETRRARIGELERLGERVGSDYFVKAERIDGDLWEVRVTPL
jgi:hypothetical protein